MSSSSLVTLRAQVEARFLAAGPRTWPDPHPYGEGPAEEEYSRCLDPGKYVIAQHRATAWVTVLVGAGVATLTSRGRRNLAPWGTLVTSVLTPRRHRAEPMFLHFTSDRLPGVIVAYGHPRVVLASQPVCGCDACDDGSDALIAAIDEAIESVVRGAVLMEQGKRGVRVVTMRGEAMSVDLDPDPERVIGRWNGAAWLA
jgi:hypothetical protein